MEVEVEGYDIKPRRSLIRRDHALRAARGLIPDAASHTHPSIMQREFVLEPIYIYRRISYAYRCVCTLRSCSLIKIH